MARIGKTRPAIYGAATKGISAKQNNMMIQIANQFKDTSRKDIKKWRQALQVANNPDKPRLTMLQDLYDDLLTDGHVQSQMQLRIYSSLNTDFYIQDVNGSINEAATDLFNQQWFYDLLQHALESIFRGTGVLQFEYFQGHIIKHSLFKRRNVVPSIHTVFPDLTKEQGEVYTDPIHENWIIQLGKEDHLGLLNNIIPNMIWKRNVAQSWAEFCERFGMPLISATTNRTTTKDIGLIENMLKRLGEAAYGVFPEGTQIQFQESNRQDAYQVYDKFIERNNSEISKAIVGGTMLSDNGSSRSQGEVHERNLDDKIAKTDKRYLTFLVNDQLMPLLRNQGYTELGENDRIVFEQGHDLQLDKYWTITQGILQDHEVDTEWLKKTFGIPIVGKKKTIVPTLTAAYKLPKYPLKGCSGAPMVTASNTFSKSFKALLKSLTHLLIAKIWNKEDPLPEVAQMTALEGTEFLKGLVKGWGDRRLDLDYNAPDHLALSQLEFNVFEFAATKTEARLASISDLLINRETLQIRSFADFKKEALKIADQFNEHYLLTEYNMTVAVAQNSANMIRFRSEADTVTSLVQYQTVGDSKVRSAHAALDGKVFSLKDNEAMTLLPPNGYGCRCEFVQFLDKPRGGVMSGATAKRILGEGFERSQFNIDRSKINKVFTNEQFYSDTKGLPKKLKDMKFDSTYGLKPYSQIRKNYKPIGLDSSISPDNVQELFQESGQKNGKAFMGYHDYLKRKLILKENDFKKHLSEVYIKENRHQLFPKIKEVLTHPDEVYLYEYAKGNFQIKYIKFYSDQTLVVPAQLRDENLTIKTWYPMKESEEQKVRSGLLIKKRKV